MYKFVSQMAAVAAFSDIDISGENQYLNFVLTFDYDFPENGTFYITFPKVDGQSMIS